MRRTAGSWRLEDAEKFSRSVPEENPLGPQGVSLQSEGTDEAERTSPEEPIRSEDYYKPRSSSGMAQTG